MSLILRSKPVQKAFQLFHHHFLSEKEPGSTLADLTFDTDVRKSADAFRRKQWQAAEAAHYGFLAAIIAFVFLIFPAPFLVKIPLLAAFSACFAVPLTAQFFRPALPIFTWLALFFSASKIPHAWKPAISVRFLPAMETIMYGDNLSNVLAETSNAFLDVLAWLPYGFVHFASPFVVALLVFLFAPPTSLRSFGFAFGYMNLAGVLIQLLFPAAAPWYKNIHGLEPANYAMDGSPGGLERIDRLFGVDMYTSAFQNSPLVFGAFPSLHSGCAVMDVLFLCWLFPACTPVWWAYAALLWWSTMYLTHHYFIDLIFGAALSFAFFTFVKYTRLPVVDPAKYCRWSYTQVTLVDVSESDPLASYVPLHADLESANGTEYFGHPRANPAAGMEMHSLGHVPAKAPVPRTNSLSPTEGGESVQDDFSTSESVSTSNTNVSSNTSLHDGSSGPSAAAKTNVLKSKGPASA